MPRRAAKHLVLEGLRLDELDRDPVDLNETPPALAISHGNGRLLHVGKKAGIRSASLNARSSRISFSLLIHRISEACIDLAPEGLYRLNGLHCKTGEKVFSSGVFVSVSLYLVVIFYWDTASVRSTSRKNTARGGDTCESGQQDPLEAT